MLHYPQKHTKIHALTEDDINAIIDMRTKSKTIHAAIRK